MHIKEIITATTSAVKMQYLVETNSSSCVTLCASGLASGEEIAIEFPVVADPDPTDDNDWEQLVYDSEDQNLTINFTCRTFYSNIFIRINKPTTAGSVGVVAMSA